MPTFAQQAVAIPTTIPVRELLPWVIFAGLVCLLGVYFVGAERTRPRSSRACTCMSSCTIADTCSASLATEKNEGGRIGLPTGVAAIGGLSPHVASLSDDATFLVFLGPCRLWTTRRRLERDAWTDQSELFLGLAFTQVFVAHVRGMF